MEKIYFSLLNDKLEKLIEREELLDDFNLINNIVAKICIDFSVPEEIGGIPAYYFENSLRGLKARKEADLKLDFESIFNYIIYQKMNEHDTNDEIIEFINNFLKKIVIENEFVIDYAKFKEYAKQYLGFFRKIIYFIEDESLEKEVFFVKFKKGGC